MSRRIKEPGTPTYHGTSTRHGQPAKRIVARPRDAREIVQDDMRRNFEAGFMLGLAIGIGVLVLVLWFWAIPTVDGCMEAVRGLA